MSCLSWVSGILALITALGTLLGALVALFASIAALRQWKQQIRIQRAEFVKQLIEKLRFDEAVTEAGYLVDYGEFQYPEGFFDLSNERTENNKRIERQIDQYLSYLSYLCYLIETGSITEQETQLFEYKLVRTLQSLSVQAYLWNLVHFSKKFNVKCSFHNLIMYGINRKIIDVDFLTNDKKKYPKILTF